MGHVVPPAGSVLTRLVPVLLMSCLLGHLLFPSALLAQSLIKGVDEWAEATTKGAAPKWAGPRVVFPTPASRPQLDHRLDSPWWPLSVHWGPGTSEERARRVMQNAEAAMSLLRVTGWSETFGDGGQGGTPGYDLYIEPVAEHGANAFLDASEPMWGLDAARAFAVLDARVPQGRLFACATQALSEAMLFEQDPAEAESVRRSSAAYLAWLITGDMGCDDEENGRMAEPELAALGADGDGRGVEWLAQLGHRQDLNRGTFLRDMWQFARQRTWEGMDLRASPDLFEVIAAALGQHDEQLENVAAELAEQRALSWLKAHSTSVETLDRKGRAQQHRVAWRELAWSKLPARVPVGTPVESLGSRYVLVNIDQALASGERLRVWSHGEFGTRWALSLLALDGEQRVMGRISAPPRKNPNSYATLELLPGAQRILVSVTNVDDGIPDADESGTGGFWVALTLDRAGGGALSDGGELP